MNRIPPVKSVMTAFPYSIDEGQDIAAAMAMMDEHQIRHLPVTRDGRLFGIVSDSDLRVALGMRSKHGGEAGLPVGLLCVQELFVVDLESPLDEVALEMAGRQVGSVLVTRGEKLAGILTTTDVCRLLGQVLRESFPPAGDDEVA